MRLSLFIVLIALFLPSLALAQAKERAAARAGLEAYNKGEYETALKKFKEAEAGVSTLQQSEQILVRRYLAYCLVAFGRRDEAKAQFRAALTLDPAMKLDAAQVSPKILETFEEARKEQLAAAATPTPPPKATPTPAPTSVAVVATPAPTPSPKETPTASGGMSRGKAAMYSGLAPGLGQFRSGRPITGAVFAGAAATSLITAGYLHSQASTAESYIDKAGPEERQDMYKQAKSFSSQRDMMLGVFALTWAGSVGEAYFRTPSGGPPRRRVGVAPMVDPAGSGGGGVVVVGRF